jgi:uncharacterized membrane protein YdjX (TVP38/TMEM64 family)
VKRFTLLIVAMILVAGFYYYDARGFSDVQQLRQSIADLGMLAPIVYIALIALTNPFFVPVLVFLVPSALIWDFPTLLLLTWLGVIGSSVHGFVFARYLAQDFVRRHMPAGFLRYERKITENGFRSTVILRLSCGLFPPVHWLLGLSHVKFWPHFYGTALGYFPISLLLTYVVSVLGSSLGDWLASQTQTSWWIVGLAIVGIILSRFLWRRYRTRAD